MGNNEQSTNSLFLNNNMNVLWTFGRGRWGNLQGDMDNEEETSKNKEHKGCRGEVMSCSVALVV